MNKKQLYFETIAEKWDSFQDEEKDKIVLTQLVAMMPILSWYRILEVGCGTGRLIPYILPFLDERGHITAIDFAPRMIFLAQEKFPCPQITYLVADAQKLPCKNNSFDMIICFSSFPHFRDKLSALYEFNKILVDKGKLIIAHHSSREELNRFHHGLEAPVKYDFLPSERKMKSLLKASNFTLNSLVDKPGIYLLIAEKR